MKFHENLNNALEELHLLKHPFYQAWNMGALSQETLQTYAKEYYHHVAAFPRYISQIHALCGDIKARQVLLDNLIDEEKGEDNHPELWLRFTEGLGISRENIAKEPELKLTKELVDGFFKLVQEDYATGLGALYAYERQTPEVAKSKIDGLKKHYNIHDERTLQFFEVHGHTDVWHTEELVSLIDKLGDSEKDKVAIGAQKGARLLWGFLDGMMECHEC
jgi:pyrroloquinoline-quinone synthase